MKFWITKTLGEKIKKATKDLTSEEKEIDNEEKKNKEDFTEEEAVSIYNTDKAIQVGTVQRKRLKSNSSASEMMNRRRSVSSSNDTIPEKVGRLRTASRKISRKNNTLSGLAHLVSASHKTSIKPFTFHHSKSDKLLSHPVNKLINNFLNK